MKCLDAVRRTTIVVLPLLSAMGLRANAILPTSNVVCSSNATSTCSAAAASLTGSSVDGVQLYVTNNPLSFVGGTPTSPIPATITLTTSGNLAGDDLQAGSIPLAFNFTLDWASTPGTGDVINGWSLAYGISSGATQVGITAFGNPGAVAVGTPIGGTSAIDVLEVASGDPLDLLASLSVIFTSDSGNQLNITIPSGSLDFGAKAVVTPIPEPSSFGFLALGLATLVWISVRKRQPMFRMRRARPETLQ